MSECSVRKRPAKLVHGQVYHVESSILGCDYPTIYLQFLAGDVISLKGSLHAGWQFALLVPHPAGKWILYHPKKDGKDKLMGKIHIPDTP